MGKGIVSHRVGGGGIPAAGCPLGRPFAGTVLINLVRVSVGDV